MSGTYRSVLVTTLFLWLNSGAAHDLLIHGIVRDQQSRSPLQGVRVALVSDGKPTQGVFTDLNGRYSLDLAFDQVHRVEYSVAGRVGKHILVDLRDVPEDERESGYTMEVDIRLFPLDRGQDTNALALPMGKARYYPERGALEWDLAYTDSVRKLLDLPEQQPEPAADEVSASPHDPWRLPKRALWVVLLVWGLLRLLRRSDKDGGRYQR